MRPLPNPQIQIDAQRAVRPSFRTIASDVNRPPTIAAAPANTRADQSVEGAPDPRRFGLTTDRLEHFRSNAREHEWLPVILSWVSFLVLLTTANEFRDWVLKDSSVRWFALFLYFIPGLVVGVLLNRCHVALDEHLKKRQPDHAAFCRFQEAERAHLAVVQAASQRKRQRCIEEESRRRKEEAWWRSLNGRQFEQELTTLLRNRGFCAQRKGGSGDGGIDIEFEHQGKRIIVQCKALKNYVGPSTVRDLYGTLLHENANEAWLITTSNFYSGARAFAQGKPIRLITMRDILKDTWNP